MASEKLTATRRRRGQIAETRHHAALLSDAFNLSDISPMTQVQTVKVPQGSSISRVMQSTYSDVPFATTIPSRNSFSEVSPVGTPDLLKEPALAAETHCEPQNFKEVDIEPAHPAESSDSVPCGQSSKIASFRENSVCSAHHGRLDNQTHRHLSFFSAMGALIVLRG